jgi:hypothetical protein
LETEPLVNGQATLSTIQLSFGAQSLKAYYGGDSNDSPSTSAVLSQSVNAVPGYGFGATTTYIADAHSQGLAVADFNGDGKPDLAVGGEPIGSFSVLLGNGDGTFQPPVNVPAPGSGALVVGDFNGDGKADIAYANSGGSTIASGEFNGDGHTDLVVTNRVAENLSVFIGNGDGTFQGAVNYPAGDFPYFVAVGDFNGDGKADLADGDADRIELHPRYVLSHCCVQRQRNRPAQHFSRGSPDGFDRELVDHDDLVTESVKLRQTSDLHGYCFAFCRHRDRDFLSRLHGGGDSSFERRSRILHHLNIAGGHALTDGHLQRRCE